MNRELTQQERGALAVMRAQDGFKVLIEIAEQSRDELKESMTDAENDQDILKQHARCRGAAEFWGKLLTRINTEVELLGAQRSEIKNEPLPDITEGMIV